jgi:hypothetical protein
MGKKDQNIQRGMIADQSGQGKQIADAALQKQNKAVDAFDTRLNKLTATNPYEDTGYQQNAKLLEGSIAAGQNQQTEAALRDAVQRTGTNSAALGYNLRAANRDKARLLADLQAGRQRDDYNKWIDLQKWATGASLQPASVYGQQAQIGTGLQSNALDQQGRLAAIPGTFGTIMNTAAGLGGAALQGYLGRPRKG